MKSRALNLFLLLICFKGCISFEILGLFPTAAQSHYLVGSALMKRLADAGHQVTVYSKFKLPEPVKNYKEIILSNVEVDPIGEDLYQEDQKSLLSKLGSLSKIGKRISNETVSDPVFQELLQSDRHFDLVIMEVFHTHALLGLGQHFNAPVVVMTTFGDTIWTTQLVGSPSPAAFVPNPSLEFTHNMKFKERLQNTFYSFAEYLILHYRTYPQQVSSSQLKCKNQMTIYFSSQERYYLIAFPEAKKTFQEVIKSDVSLVLQNTHFSLNYPRPLMPNVIEVGGIQIERTPKPLPQDLQTILDSAENGAIYFSMGSILKATLMSAEKLQAIVSAFARVNLTVLCTWEGDFDSELVRPENVITRKWLPQNSVLAHPNVRLMITHGGLLSMTEATFHGIPVIGLTVNADQRLNVERAKVAGFARMIPYNRLTANVLHETIEEILADNR